MTKELIDEVFEDGGICQATKDTREYNTIPSTCRQDLIPLGNRNYGNYGDLLEVH
jgi:hypothetical protein